MTSENEALKTTEFIRRRKLRLQQVREQSKDIAKKIRQRAKVEKLRQVVDLDVKKQKEYLQRQGELVKKLEDLYSKGIENVGASHRSASEFKEQDEVRKVDVSKLRGREAAAELRRKKQEKLNEQKKILDRKTQAREAANEISREKSTAIGNKLINKTGDNQDKATIVEEISKENENHAENAEDKDKPVTNDMATQWDLNEPEWESNIPTLALPKDDSPKADIESRSDKSKRLDLFALSEEMPSSLRGRITNEERVPIKPSLTVVSEYLQNRVLRLRETSTTAPKKPSEDLLSIKETILRTRPSRPEGTVVNACCVLDEQLIPVPSWQAEQHCGFCSHSVSYDNSKNKHFHTTNSQGNKIFSSCRSVEKRSPPTPVLRGSTSRRNRVFQQTFKSNTEKSSKSSAVDSGMTKNKSVTMYNHSTRDTRDVRGDEGLVVRDQPNDDDAYSQARRETILDNSKHIENQKKYHEMRHRVAMTKQNVEKEYKDTINFLNSLPKDKERPIRKAYMDEHRQQMQKDNREQKLQQEYKKIEKECQKHSCAKGRSKTKSPVKIIDDDSDYRDFQYSWMPVPESDGSLAIHTIPTTVKGGKSGNTVKFSKVDSYHEYRSRHRHTPPTKDTSDKQTKRVEAVIIEKNSSDVTDCSSNASESSSIENIRLDPKDARAEKERELSDAERIIIYKILDSKSDKKCRKKEKLMQNILKSLNSIDNNKKRNIGSTEFTMEQHGKPPKDVENKTSTFEQLNGLNEGIYKTVTENGDNITSMSTHVLNSQSGDTAVDEYVNSRKHCRCSEGQPRDKNTNSHFKNGDTSRSSNSCVSCKCGCTGPSKSSDNNPPIVQKSASSVATSINSFKTATNDKAKSALPDGGYVKLIDNVGQEAGKFYIGASGFLKDDAYEVVIQLRKKDGLSDKNDEQSSVDQTSGKEVPNASQVSQQVTVETPKITQENKDDHANERNGNNQEPTPEITNNIEPTLANPEIICIQESEKRPNDLCENVNAQNENNQQKKLVDKGVHTSFQMSYAIPSHVPKLDPISRPATSTYTQTTLSSPNHRPVFFHMSSSTSTAYMSPPELVLPQFLKQDYRMTDEEKYDTMQILNRHGYMSEQEYSEGYDGCRCKKCTHAKKIINNKIKPHDCYKKQTRYGNKLDTPPNTARSQSSGNMCSHKIKKTKNGGFSTSVKSHIHKQKHHSSKINHKPSKSVGLHPNPSAASSYKNNQGYPDVRKNITRSDLNPVLKKYVNKLLALNKESLKAIEVADQDCSAVTTPGSSIINVTNNINKNKPLENKISFEQIKDILKQQIINGKNKDKREHTLGKTHCTQNSLTRRNVRASRFSRKKTVHKVKSLNISKHLQNSKIHIPPKCSSGNIASSWSPMKGDALRESSIDGKPNGRSKISPTPKQQGNVYPTNSSTTPDMTPKRNFTALENDIKTNQDCGQYNDHKVEIPPRRETNTLPYYQSSLATSSSDTDNNLISQNLQHNLEIPIATSTQTSQAEINLIKLAEDKLQNMEKIADLTEKCTKRLSNLAKVLEEVRKNKSLVYSQISTSDNSSSDSDQKSDKKLHRILTPTQVLDVGKTSRTSSPMTISTVEEPGEKNVTTDTTDFVPFLNDIPKPSVFKTTEPTNLQNLVFSKKINSQSQFKNLENTTTLGRGRPPPALSRITLKNGHDNIIPHELSTVLEVDSLPSVRLPRDNKDDVSEDSNKTIDETAKQEISKAHSSEIKDSKKDPDLLRSNANIPTRQSESSDDSKLQVIDINKFNDIMLKPFITFQEHVKKCNIAFDEASNLEDIANDVVTEDISSLHSDGSLPDVIAELLKRKIIREPFKFDTASNVNSTSVSSESTLSLLALSKVKKDNKKSSVFFQNKENVGETSDSLSLSSNPDLEMAFKKLGMGWASSTLKKTKERLALSSSTNTSSSSLSQFKLKTFTNQDIPVLVTDSVSSILNVTKKPENRRTVNFNSKNAQQQTSLTNSMTVKDFLTNELAKKITFTNKSHRDETADEFVSLFETKMPEDMKDSEHMPRTDNSAESVRSGNRARTSTPVQIFKSMTYHSSSSSNLSNGLFSNADDLSSVKVTSNSNKNHSTSDKDDLTVPNFTLRMKKSLSDCSKSD